MNKQKIKLLMLSFDWRNGFENDFPDLLRKLRRDSHNPELNDFFIFSWSTKSYHRKSGNFETLHLKAIFGRMRLFYDIINIVAVPIAMALKGFRPDLVVINDFQSAFSSVLVKLFFKVKIVLILGALPSDLAKTRRFGFVKWIYSRLSEIIGRGLIDYNVAIGEATKKYFLDLGMDESRISIINPDTISPDREFIESAIKGSARKKHGIGDGAKILFSVGRLQPEKGYEDLIDAFTVFKGENAYLLIAGDGPLKGQMEESVRILGLERQVIFLGHLKRQDLWNYYLDADAFILLSKSEGLGLVFWEAMFARVPVIGSRIGGIIDTIGQNQERGYFWDKKEGRGSFKNIVDVCFYRLSTTEEKIKSAESYVKGKISDKTDINEIYEICRKN